MLMLHKLVPLWVHQPLSTVAAPREEEDELTRGGSDTRDNHDGEERGDLS